MPQWDAVSFFFVLFIVATFLASLLIRYGFTKQFHVADGFRFGLFWAVFVTVVLVMNQIGRETLDPGRWPSEKLFEPITTSETVGWNAPVKNLILGWILFPVRILPKVQIGRETLLIGIVVFFFSGILLESIGRWINRHWRTQWTLTALGCFLLLNVMTCSTVGFVRHVGWMLTC